MVNGYAQGCIEVVLVHWPVVNKKGERIGSAVTNLDIHDIARACKTYGVRRYWIVTPFEEQCTLVQQIVEHWTKGHGGRNNPDRRDALHLVQVRLALDQVIAEVSDAYGVRPLVAATCARVQDNTLGYEAIQEHLKTERPMLLLFGTAWGLAPEIMHRVDVTLPPIQGRSEYNHLSVRSAASIILDRLLGS
ncbi:MAG: hypothetical protein CSA33_08350 [Desulfobulbus propionicus]|nr:MAG: hypothetical protein CSA33_08350 [Desulfobulbus propionicus]